MNAAQARTKHQRVEAAIGDHHVRTATQHDHCDALLRGPRQARLHLVDGRGLEEEACGAAHLKRGEGRERDVLTDTRGTQNQGFPFGALPPMRSRVPAMKPSSMVRTSPRNAA